MTGLPTRRNVLAGGAGLVAASMLTTGSMAASAPTPETRAIPWELAAAMPGVCLKTSGHPWERTDDLLQAMKEAGFTWLRTRYTSSAHDALVLYGSNGIQLQLIAGDPMDSVRPADHVQSVIDGGLVPYVLGFEGANEWNLKEREAWVQELLLHQSELYRAVKGDPTTRHSAVIGPALGMVKDYDLWGFRAELMTCGNTHIYSGGNTPELKSEKSVMGPRLNCGELPVIVTETGWHTASKWTGSHHPTPASVARVYAPRTYAEYLRLGVPRLAFYQLADAGLNDSDREDNFGILDYTLRPKDHFAAIANFNKIIATAGSGTGSVTSLARRVTGPEDVRSVAVRGPAGRYLLLVWRETQIWDPLRQRSLNVSARQVAIDWGSSPRTVTTYWPSRSAEPTERAQERVTTVNLAAELAILEVAA